MSSMNPLLHLVKFSSKHSQSHSILVDIQQIYLRNVILFCTGLSMIQLLFGEVIVCQNTVNAVSQTFIDTKCYINGTMTKGSSNGTTPTIYHDYYQWVSVYLLLLAFGFYFPYSIWLKLFGSFIRHLETLAEKPNEVIQIIKESKGNFIFYKTLALEVVYIFYLIIILILTDVFFNGLWSRFNWSLTAVYKIFPDNGSCYIDYYHSSGSSDAWFNCLLPVCSIYRKVFSLLYVLVLHLFILNGIMITYRIIMAFHKGKNVDIWWAFQIVHQCTVSWNVKKKLNEGLNEILETRKLETFEMKTKWNFFNE